MIEVLQILKEGRRAEIPRYSFAKHRREEETTSIYGANVLILEGIFALFDPRVRDLLDMKIFVTEDSDICLARRLLRDIRDRGRDVQGVLTQYQSFVKPNFERYVLPTSAFADLIVPRGIENTVALNIITNHIRRGLGRKSEEHLQHLESLGRALEPKSGARVVVLPLTNQRRGIHTILQDRQTSLQDFVFYFDRFARSLIDEALNLVPFEGNIEVQTPLGRTYNGVKTTSEICAVEILRAGGCFERPLRECIPGAQIGKLLIQSNTNTGEPEFHYINLPKDIVGKKVLVLDAQLVTGSAALMAIAILTDYGVPEQDIIFVTYMAMPRGLTRLACAFGVHVIVGIQGELGEAIYARRFVDKSYFGA